MTTKPVIKHWILLLKAASWKSFENNLALHLSFQSSCSLSLSHFFPSPNFDQYFVKAVIYVTLSSFRLYLLENITDIFVCIWKLHVSMETSCFTRNVSHITYKLISIHVRITTFIYIRTYELRLKIFRRVRKPANSDN